MKLRPSVAWFVSGVALAFGSCSGDDAYTTRTIAFEVEEGTNLAFDLSPDGETIVFDLLGQLWALPVDGGDAVALTNAVRDTAEDVGPSFSPDGHWIAFWSDRPGGPGVWIVPADGGDPKRLTSHAFDLWGGSIPAWSSDSQEVVYAVWDTLYRVDVAQGTTTPVPVTFEGPAPRGLGSPATAPGGTRLAFGSGSGGTFRALLGRQSRIWETGWAGGLARAVTDPTLRAVSPAYSPEGDRMAFFATDADQGWQLWVMTLPGGEPIRLTDQPEMAIRRVRWTPDGERLMYSASGRLWQIDASGGAPVEIPFSAPVQFQRRVASLPAVTFPSPGEQMPARGFEDIALSPDGRRIAMAALGRIWVWEPADSPVPVADTPPGAVSLSWSADGRTLVFSAEDLFAVDVETGETRQLTSLPGPEELQAVSPDGAYIAFVAGRPCRGCSQPGQTGQVRVISMGQGPVGDTSETRLLGEAPFDLIHSLVWSPDSRSVLAYNAYPFVPNRVQLYTLAGETRALDDLPPTLTYIRWPVLDSILYVQGSRIWKSSFDSGTGEVGEAVALSSDPAWFPEVARDGSVLYVSEDGLRLRRPDGTTTSIRWPVSYQVPPAPPPLLVRNVRVIDGRGGVVAEPQDILIEKGRIARISPTGAGAAAVGVSVLEGGGRTILPGFVDAHRHLYSNTGEFRQLVAALYYGTTTFRDVGSEIHLAAAWRDQVDAGRFPGARFVLSSPMFQGQNPPVTMGLSDWYNQYVVDPVEIGRAISISHAFGAQLVKHRGFSDWASLVATIEEAHRQGMRVTGHCMTNLPAVAAGADGQEHAAQCLREMSVTGLHADVGALRAAAGMWTAAAPARFQPGLRWSELSTREDLAQLMLEHERAFYQQLSDVPDINQRGDIRRKRDTRVLYESGAPLVSGTDLTLPNMTQLALESFVDAGLSPLEAIQAATYNGALALGAEVEIGSIEVGKLADLVILDGDPLEDISNTDKIWQVIKNGEVVDRSRLLHFMETVNR